MTGSTDTSLWTVYNKGMRNYCGNDLPDGMFSNLQHLPLFFWLSANAILFPCVIGMVKNQKLPGNIITPTTKGVDHDVPVSPEEV